MSFHSSSVIDKIKLVVECPECGREIKDIYLSDFIDTQGKTLYCSQCRRDFWFDTTELARKIARSRLFEEIMYEFTQFNELDLIR